MADLPQLLTQIDRLRDGIDSLRPIAPANVERIMQKLELDWTFHSNSIEGNTLTYGETKAFLLHGITAQGKPFRDYLDIKGHAEALEHLTAIVRQQKPLTEADLRELHKIILVEPYETRALTTDGLATRRTIRPGQYKTMPNHVRTVTGRIHYYATPEETPAMMADLMAWYRRQQAESTLHPLVLAATFHYRFVAIHPFDDGNGRMARLLMNLILMQGGYPPAIVHINTKQDYLLALAQADEDDNLEPFITFIGQALIRSLDIYLRGAKGENISELSDIDKKIKLLEYKIEAKNEYDGQQKQKVLSIRLNWHDQFLKPFLFTLLDYLQKFDHLFEQADFQLKYGEMLKQGVIEGENLNAKLDTLAKTFYTETNAPSIQLNYIWNRFKGNVFSIELILNIDLHKNGFDVGYVPFLHKHKSSPNELSAPFVNLQASTNNLYAAHYSQDELDEFILPATNIILQMIEYATISE